MQLTLDLTVEYLVIVEKATNEALFHLCRTPADLRKLLESNESLRISRQKIQFRNSLVCNFSISSGELIKQSQRFFLLKIIFQDEEDALDNFLELLKAVRSVLHRAEAPPETLWDDVSLYFSKKAYPLVHRSENLMRKLITYFMLTTVGKHWASEHLPKTVEIAIDRSKRKQYRDILHQVDFSQLSDFLFKKYPTRKLMDDLFAQLGEAESSEDLDLQELQV